MFTVNYRKEDDKNGGKAGDIVSYHGGEDAKDNKVPDGCSPLSFASQPTGFFTDSHMVAMKVDVKTGKLSFINPILIPDPLPNPENAAK